MNLSWPRTIKTSKGFSGGGAKFEKRRRKSDKKEGKTGKMCIEKGKRQNVNYFQSPSPMNVMKTLKNVNFNVYTRINKKLYSCIKKTKQKTYIYLEGP